jgi:hypothetical protein
VEVFQNDIRVYTFYFDPVDDSVLQAVTKQFGEMQTMPVTSLTDKYLSGSISAEEYAYATAASMVSYYFLNRRCARHTARLGPLRRGALADIACIRARAARRSTTRWRRSWPTIPSPAAACARCTAARPRRTRVSST